MLLRLIIVYCAMIKKKTGINFLMENNTSQKSKENIMGKRIISILAVIMMLSGIYMYARSVPSVSYMETEKEESAANSWTADDSGYLNEIMESIDFSVQKYPVNTAIYDSELDKEYKTAFLKVLFGQVPIQDEEKGEYYFGEIIPELNEYSNGIEMGDFMNVRYYITITSQLNYYYMDFDGDGILQELPSLNVPAIEEDEYITALKEHIEGMLRQNGQSGEYEMNIGEYEAPFRNRVCLSAAVTGEEDSYYFRYLIIKSGEGNYYFWPAGFGLNGSLTECEAERHYMNALCIERTEQLERCGIVIEVE